MSDPVLTFGVVLLGLVMLWFFGAFDEPVESRYDIALSGGGLRFSDERVELRFPFENPVDVEELRHIPLTLKNKTSLPLKISSCLFTDPGGRQRKVAADLFSDVREGAPAPGPAVLAPGAEASVLLIPRDNIVPADRLYNKIGGSRPYKHRYLLLADWLDDEGFAFKLRLGLCAGEESLSYELEFKAARRDPAPS